MAVVVQLRGGIVESEHPWAAVAVRGGEVTGVIGSPMVTAFRSAAKPLQLDVALQAMGDPPVSEAELAIGAASHSAQPHHLELVRAILSRLSVDPACLRCAAHPPVHGPSADRILIAGGSFSDIHNNCSGKHAFMLAAARHNGWPLDYRPPDHPLQRRIHAFVAELAGVEPQVAVDGCGVPTFGLPLRAMAACWGHLAAAMADPADARLGRIGRAMAARPDLTAGTDRLDPAVVQGAQETMAVKIGAEGLFCMALPERRLGIAVKVRTGNSDALAMAVTAALDGLAPGAFVMPEHWPWRTLRNVAGAPVGHRELRS